MSGLLNLSQWESHPLYDTPLSWRTDRYGIGGGLNFCGSCEGRGGEPRPACSAQAHGAYADTNDGRGKKMGKTVAPILFGVL